MNHPLQNEREREIVRGAVAYFAEVGFEGSTRDPAARLGITQPLLYRYLGVLATYPLQIFRGISRPFLGPHKQRTYF
jgi:hypothetical protein